jgi:hypothetical protein
MSDAEPTLSERAKVDQPSRVTGIGALCEVDSIDGRSSREQSFSVAEFVDLEDGRRVILHHDRGFTTAWGAGVPEDDIRTALTEASLIQDALNVVLPDDDNDPDDHPWPWLAKLAQARGLDVTEAELRELTYEVVLAPGLLEWLQGGEPLAR